MGAPGRANPGVITACYWSGDSAQGIGSGTDTTIKVEGTTTWLTAATAMNEALLEENPDFGWKWQTDDAATPPTLVKKE